MNHFDKSLNSGDTPDSYEESDEAEPIDEGDYSTLEDAAQILADYWPNSDEDKLFSILCEKESAYYDALERRGFLQQMRACYAQYYGLSNSGSNQFETQSIQFAGEDGELAILRVNEFRSYCDQIFNMTCKNRPAFQAQAINTDATTLGQIESSDSIIRYYYEQVFGERKEKEVVKCEGLYGKAFTYLEWDADGGPDVEIEEEVETEFGPIKQKKTVKAGQFLISRAYPWFVICELYRSEHDDHLWRTVNTRRSKWEMIARYPLYASRIEEQESGRGDIEHMFPGADTYALEEDTDSVLVRTFLHVPCASLPEGKKIVYVGNVQVMNEGLPIEVLPIVDFMSCEMDGTSFGVSDLWNLIPLSQLKDQILSDMATSIEAFGRPTLGVVRGSNLDVDALANGQKIALIDSIEQLPQVIPTPQVTDTPIKLVEFVRKLEQSLTGLNATSRGEASASVKSGAHAALEHAIAAEAQAPRSAALDLHRERVTNIILMFLKKFATHPQLVAIAGEDERANLQLFSKTDIAHVHRVVIKTANPMMRTQAGRLQLAELLRDWPGSPLKDPQEIIELIVSGQFKPLYQATRVQSLRIRRENQLLAAGPAVTEVPDGVDETTGQPKTKKTVTSVPVFFTDDARSHILGHLEIMVSADTLQNPKKLQATFAHIQEHINQARTGDPYLAQLIGISPPPPPPGLPGGAPDPNATASGKEGPSDDDMSRVQDASKPPAADTGDLSKDDSMSGVRMPTASKPPPGSNPALQ